MRKSSFRLRRSSQGKGLSFIVWMVEQTRIWAPPYAGFMRDQIQNRWEVGGRFICFSSVIVEAGWKGASCGDHSRVEKAM